MKAILKINYTNDTYIDFGYDGVSDNYFHYWLHQNNPDVGMYFLKIPNKKKIKKFVYK